MGHKSGVHFCALRSRLHPLRQVSATSRQGQQILKVELQFEFGDAIFLFEFVHYIHFTVSRSGELIPRTTARTYVISCSHAPLLAPLIPPCPHVRGANLTTFARLCAQEASSTSILSMPNEGRRLWQVQVRTAPRSGW